MELLDPEATGYVLDRMAAEAARYGRGFALVRLRMPAEEVEGAVPRLRTALRDADVLGRWDDEELVVFMPETDGDGARAAVERLRETIRDVAVLAGAAEWTGGSPDSLLRRAAWASARP